MGNINCYGAINPTQGQRKNGLPVCVGVARSKTLAKLANHVGKKWLEFDSLCGFTAMSNEDLSALLKTIVVSEVWGVGRRINEKFNGFDIHTVEDLKT